MLNNVNQRVKTSNEILKFAKKTLYLYCIYPILKGEVCHFTIYARKKAQNTEKILRKTNNKTKTSKQYEKPLLQSVGN